MGESRPNLQPTLTGELLLTLTKEFKAQTFRRALKQKVTGACIEFAFQEVDIMVTQEDIEIMADTLKWHVFFVPGSAYREAIKLAEEEGSLRIESNWLQA
jgi:hypothetical protein